MGENLETALQETREAAAEQTAAATEAVIEQAQENIEQAQDAAKAIAEAAMQTELGRQIESVRQENAQWQGKVSSLEMGMETIKGTLSEIQATMAASLTLQATQLQPSEPPVSVSLTPPQSEVMQAADQVTAALPESLGQSAVIESAEPSIRKARKLFL